MKTEEFEIKTEADMLVFAEQLAKRLKPGMIIYLSGPLGAGKTTLVRGVLRSLGFNGKVKSPTYTLVEPYEFADYKIYHFDLYRLKSAEELIYLGIDDYLNSESICLIEWAEYGAGVLPKADLICDIRFENEVRQLTCRRD